MDFDKVGIIGSGTMGISVSIDLILHNKNVILVDVSHDVLMKAKNEILNGIRFSSLLKKSAVKIDVSSVLETIKFTQNIEEVRDCHFIVENVTEDLDIKKQVYLELCRVTDADVCIGANTSCISITNLASFTNKPDRIIGMHFMNPVYMKTVVEVIRGFHTSNECIEVAKEFLASIEKELVLVNDYPGFVTNRISHLFMNEAAFIIQDNVAQPEQVDYLFKKCYGHAMGPLETADLIGLDTVMKSLDVLYKSYQDSKYRCCPLLKKMVHAGLLGKKSGQGFYKY